MSGSCLLTCHWQAANTVFNSYSLIYPQTITLYQVDDQIYEPAEVATTNLFNTFLDALDGVSLIKRLKIGNANRPSHTAHTAPTARPAMTPKLTPSTPIPALADTMVRS